MLFLVKECRFHFQLSYKTNSVVRLKYGTAPYIFSHVTNIKYQHRKDLLTTLF